MNLTQKIQTGQHDYVKEHSGHHFKRKWHEQTEVTGDGDGHVIKAAHTNPSIGDNTQVVEEDDEELKAKRKAQNREAQRSFRLRKEKYVKDLEMKIKQAQDSHMFTANQLYQENHHLRTIIYRLEAENSSLKGMMPLPNNNNNNNNNNNKPIDLFSTLGLNPQQQPFSPLGLTPLPPLSSFYTPAPVDMTPTTSRSSPIYPKPLAAKLPVPILPQQQKQPQLPIITAESLHPKPQVNTNEPPQEFTFSISTPATLRASNSVRNTQSDPIELIPLYHPDHSMQSTPPTTSSSPATVHSPPDNTLDITTATTTTTTTPTTTASSTTTTATTQESSPFASFLDGYDAFEQLYVHQDPSLFDNHGLDPSMVQSRRNSATSEQQRQEKEERSVLPSFVEEEEETMMMMVMKNNKMKALMKDKSASGSTAILLPCEQQQAPPLEPPRQAITVSAEDDEKTPIWQKITEHAQNNKFSVDHLVEAVRNTTTSKRKNKLLVDEWELEAMVNDLNYYL